MKYLFAALAGLAGLFLGVFLAVVVVPKTSTQLHAAFGAGCAIAAARVVYNFFNKREQQKAAAMDISEVMKPDIRDFQKAFRMIDVAAQGITEVKIAELEAGQGFYVGIRAQAYDRVDAEQITKALHKVYYNHIQFEFVDLSTAHGMFLLHSGVAVPVGATA